MISISGASTRSETVSALVSFEVPARSAGVKSSPPSGQRSPVLSPRTSPIG